MISPRMFEATRVALEVSAWLSLVSAGLALVIIIVDAVWCRRSSRRDHDS